MHAFHTAMHRLAYCDRSPRMAPTEQAISSSCFCTTVAPKSHMTSTFMIFQYFLVYTIRPIAAVVIFRLFNRGNGEIVQ